MKLLVCGGRNFTDRAKTYEVLDDYLSTTKSMNQPLEICHGNARGADTIAGEWAKERGVKCTVFPANWGEHGKAAGPIRNAQMLEVFQPDIVIAFAGGKGTLDMIKRTLKARILVRAL